MRVSLVMGVVGHVLRPFSAVFLAPMLLALIDSEPNSAVVFAATGLLSLVLGWLLSRSFVRRPTFLRSEALSVVAMTWLFVAVVGAVPYVAYGLAPVDALFESMSGFTTTGATVLASFDGLDRAFFLWRAMTQWFGGLGVIALFVVILPRLGIAGRQLFFAEASGAPAEAVSPQVRDSAQRLWLLYSGLTVTIVLLLHLISGFSWFDAVTHAFTTISAGGFSPNPQSLKGFENPSAEWVLVPFMVLAGASFTLQYKALTGKPRELLRDGEFLAYAMATLLIGGAIAALLPDAGVEESLRVGLFQSASIISSTGFASVDYNLWSDRLRVLLVAAMLIGGCAGSAAGGPKVVRLLLVFKHVAREIKKTLHPRAVLVIRHRGGVVGEEIMRPVFTLVVLYITGHLVVGTLLVLLGVDFVPGFSAALACLGNVGPGFGEVGPMGSFAGFSASSKLLLFAAMWVGRLEIVTVLALLHYDVLRGIRWR